MIGTGAGTFRRGRHAASVVALLAALVLAACASVQPPIAKSSPMEPGAAYVGGVFSQVERYAFAFTLKNLGTGQEYGMALGDASISRGSQPRWDEVVAIKLPPGRYQITHWMTYIPLTKERTSHSEVPRSALTEPFDLKAGEIRFLGNFASSTSVDGRKVRSSITQRPISSARARQVFLAAYPSFSEGRFDCPLCQDL